MIEPGKALVAKHKHADALYALGRIAEDEAQTSAGELDRQGEK